MKAKDFVKGKEFATSKGLPVGRTTIDFDSADFGERDFMQDNGETRTANQVTLTIDDKQETYNLPVSVMKKIQDGIEKGAAGVEVNREGTTKTGTHYVTYLLDQAGKIIKE